MARGTSMLTKGIASALGRLTAQSASPAAAYSGASTATSAAVTAEAAFSLFCGAFRCSGRLPALTASTVRLFGTAVAGAGCRGAGTAGMPGSGSSSGSGSAALRGLFGSGGVGCRTGPFAAVAGARSACLNGGGAVRGPSLVRTVWQDSKGYTHFQGRGSAWSLSGGGSKRALYIAGAVGAGFGAYYVYCIEQVPYTGRRHSIMLVSRGGEQVMGKQLFEETKALAAAEGNLLPPSHPDVRRVTRIGRAIAAVAGDGDGGGSQAHMRGLEWEFAVVRSPQFNAFVAPGGKVVVFSGLLRLLGDSDDELAAVLAHEVGHVLARHGAERMSTLNVWALFNMLLRLTLGFGVPNVAMFLGVFLPYSRLAEREADALGLRLMSRACFDPAAAPVMLAKLNAAEHAAAKRGSLGASLPEFLRTHPLTEERVKKVEAELPEAFRMYAAAGCAAPRGAFGRGLSSWLGGGNSEETEVVEIRFG